MESMLYRLALSISKGNWEITVYEFPSKETAKCFTTATIPAKRIPKDIIGIPDSSECNNSCSLFRMWSLPENLDQNKKKLLHFAVEKMQQLIEAEEKKLIEAKRRTKLLIELIQRNKLHDK